MKILVSKQECSKYLGVSFFRKEEDFNRYIREAQLFDLNPLLCEDFFEDLTSQNAQRNYDLLLNGGSYEFQERKYHFEGLKAVISYFAFARYLLLGHQTDTPFGVKEKNYEDGLQISSSERRDTKTMYVQNAFTLWEDCRKYIERNKENFPEWSGCISPCGKQENKKMNFRFSRF